MDYITAEDAALGQLRTIWNAETPAITGGAVPTLVFEATETDLNPHPRASGLPWARVVVRHNDGASKKVTLASDQGTARYRRWGMVWVQVYVPGTGAVDRTLAQSLAMLVQKAYEGKRAAAASMVFLGVAVTERPKDGQWFTWDVKAGFYWDQIR